MSDLLRVILVLLLVLAWRELRPHIAVFDRASLAGDPLAMLQYTPAAHAHAAKRLRAGNRRDGQQGHSVREQRGKGTTREAHGLSQSS